MIACCVLAVLASLIASSYPDGLEWVAGKLGFLESGEGREVISSPIADYSVPGIKCPPIAAILAALIGTVTVFFVAYLLLRMVRGKK